MKTFEDVFSRFDRMPTRDRQTDILHKLRGNHYVSCPESSSGYNREYINSNTELEKRSYLTLYVYSRNACGAKSVNPYLSCKV